MPTLTGVDIRPPGSDISALAEAMVLLRYVELRSRLYRLISLSKVRVGAFDPTIREFAITDAGVVVGKPFEGVPAVLDDGICACGLVRGQPEPAWLRHWPAGVSESRTVLIVEDGFAIAELLEMVLTDEGYRVLTAANGRQGQQRLAEDPRPDLVISDYMMPILDGAEMLQAMRATELQRDIPCIVMSSIPEVTCRSASGTTLPSSASRSNSPP